MIHACYRFRSDHNYQSHCNNPEMLTDAHCQSKKKCYGKKNARYSQKLASSFVSIPISLYFCTRFPISSLFLLPISLSLLFFFCRILPFCTLFAILSTQLSIIPKSHHRFFLVLKYLKKDYYLK